jgi:hypothetical protein
MHFCLCHAIKHVDFSESQMTFTVICGYSVTQLQTFILPTFSRKMKGCFIAKNNVVTSVSSASNHSIMSSQNAFHYISSSVSCCASWRWYNLNWSFFLDTFPYVCCGIWSLPIGLNSWLLQTSHKCLKYVIDSFCANMQPASAFTDTPFIHKLPIPTSDWVGYGLFISICCSVSLLNFLQWSSLGNLQTTFCLFPFKVPFSFDSDCSVTCGWYVIISVSSENITSFLAFSRLHYIFIYNHNKTTLILCHHDHLH